MAAKIGVIGGTGLYSMMEGFTPTREEQPSTPYGDISSVLTHGELHGKPVVFLARHGNPHRIAPHRVNYRANIHALKQCGVEHIIALNAVGSMHPQCPPEALAIPHQIIDYSWGRASSFFGEDSEAVRHIDFTWPYSENLRKVILQAGENLGLDLLQQATYACTQGPRLETAAEVVRLQRDGCDIVGMTAMPEAALARELELQYAAIAMAVNWAAGYKDEAVSMAQIEQHIQNAATRVHSLLAETIRIMPTKQA